MNSLPKKGLFSQTHEGITTSQELAFNMSTEHITITAKFYSHTPYYKRRGHTPYNKNKSCGMYLGCYVAERVLMKVFKNVSQMPIKNNGYDFICGCGYLVDVKSSCILNTPYKPDKWAFCIKHNKVADYFLCIAFDDRKHLTPLHLWLLPSDKFNHLTSATISSSTLDKWDKYRIDISKTQLCCDTLRAHCISEDQ